MKKYVILAAGMALSLALGTSAFTQDAAPPAPPPETAPVVAPETAPVATPEAVTVATPEAAPVAMPETAPAPEAVATPTPAAAASEKGKIIFFRPGRLPGAIYTYYVVETGDDGKVAKEAPRLGGLPNGGAFVLEVEPGVHSYNITGPMAVNYADDRIRMDVEPGETYYVEQTVRIGLVTGGFRLVPADEARFTKTKVKLNKGGK